MENNLYDYNYNDIIKAKEIIERIQAICDKEAENNKEDIIEFVKYNNMARNCASTCLLLNYYANKINDYQKFKNTRDYIFDKLINDYELSNYFTVETTNEPCRIIFRLNNNPFSTTKKIIEINEEVVGIKDNFFDETYIYQARIENFFDNSFTSEKANIIKDIANILLNFSDAMGGGANE